MGLDITAYSNLHHIGTHTDEIWRDWCQNEDHIQSFAYDTFPQSFRGIPILSTRREFIEGGCYERTDKTEEIGFHAGSYSGYGRWRADLAEQFNPAPMTWDHGPSMTEPDPDKPFYELIWFADNEGTIGPDAARDLLADFRQHADRYDPIEPLYSRQKYDDWTRACELAADNGLISFR